MVLATQKNLAGYLPGDGYFIPPQDETDLRNICRYSVERDLNGFVPLKTIHAVGAHKAFQLCGPGRDNSFVTNILTYWARSGVPIDPDFEIKIFNYAVSPENYLDSREPCDAAFMCFLRGENGTSEKAETYRPELETKRSKALATDNWRSDMRMREIFYHVIAPNHSQKNWQRRVLQSGARLVATWGGQYEISTSWLETPNLLPLISSPAVDFNHETQEMVTSDLYDYNTDIPSKWAGIMARSDCLPALAGFMNDKTEMAATIKAMASPVPHLPKAVPNRSAGAYTAGK